jgi:uncharacterized membrane protein YfcA
MPNLQTSALLFLAGCVSWTISIFSGGGGSVILLATVTHLIRVRQVAPVVTLASLMASPVRIAISWRRVEWRVVKWYLPGAMAGAMLGGWLLSWARGEWLTLIVGMFLVSSPMQYRLGERARSFPMPLPCFIPVSVVVGLVSGLVGASSLISLPFYLNYGLTKERLIATGAVHSLFIQITKIATYASVGALSSRSLLEGVAAGSGAVFAIYVTRPWLDTLKEVWFRRLAVVLMLTSGSSMLWHSRHLAL